MIVRGFYESFTDVNALRFSKKNFNLHFCFEVLNLLIKKICIQGEFLKLEDNSNQ